MLLYLLMRFSQTLELSAKSLNAGPSKEFGVSLKIFPIKRLLDDLVSEPNIETWVKTLGPPLSIKKLTLGLQ